MTYPIILASDLHIGYESTDYSAITDFLRLAQTTLGSLVLCGDTLDLWRCDLQTIQNREPYRSAYRELVKTSLIVPTRLVWGNHDYNLAGKVPFRVTDEFTQNGILYCHGWRMDLEQCLAYPLYEWLVTDFPWIYQRFFKKPTDPREKGEPCQAEEVHRIAQQVAVRKGYRCVVMGHTHCPGVYGNGLVYDLGSFTGSPTYGVIESPTSLPRLKKI